MQPTSIADVVRAASNRTAVSAYPRQRIERYCAAVDTLICDMKMWLGPQIQSASVKSHAARYVDRFENGHQYQVSAWSFEVGSHYVSLEPRGTWVVGAYGRADLVATPGDSVVLTLNEKFQWELPTRGRTRIKYELLDEAVFAKALTRALQIAT